MTGVGLQKGLRSFGFTCSVLDWIVKFLLDGIFTWQSSKPSILEAEFSTVGVLHYVKLVLLHFKFYYEKRTYSKSNY